jgi:hypothetical protein
MHISSPTITRNANWRFRTHRDHNSPSSSPTIVRRASLRLVRASSIIRSARPVVFPSGGHHPDMDDPSARYWRYRKDLSHGGDDRECQRVVARIKTKPQMPKYTGAFTLQPRGRRDGSA